MKAKSTIKLFALIVAPAMLLSPSAWATMSKGPGAKIDLHHELATAQQQQDQLAHSLRNMFNKSNQTQSQDVIDFINVEVGWGKDDKNVVEEKTQKPQQLLHKRGPSSVGGISYI